MGDGRNRWKMEAAREAMGRAMGDGMARRYNSVTRPRGVHTLFTEWAVSPAFCVYVCLCLIEFGDLKCSKNSHTSSE